MPIAGQDAAQLSPQFRQAPLSAGEAWVESTLSTLPKCLFGHNEGQPLPNSLIDIYL